VRDINCGAERMEKARGDRMCIIAITVNNNNNSNKNNNNNHNNAEKKKHPTYVNGKDLNYSH
jgi:hypothetical protein